MRMPAMHGMHPPVLMRCSSSGSAPCLTSASLQVSGMLRLATHLAASSCTQRGGGRLRGEASATIEGVPHLPYEGLPNMRSSPSPPP